MPSEQTAHATQHDEQQARSGSRPAVVVTPSPAFALSGAAVVALGPAAFLQVQRFAGNAVAGRLAATTGITVQRDPPPVGGTDTDAAYRRARAIIDEATAAELPSLRRDVGRAMDSHGLASGVLLTLRLGTQDVPGISSERLGPVG